MRSVATRHFLDTRAVIFDLAEKELAILWSPMTMRMQLNIDAVPSKLPDFFRGQVVHNSLLEQSVVINAKLRRQFRCKCVFLVGR